MAIEDRHAEVLEHFESKRSILDSDSIVQIEHLMDAFAEMYEDDAFSVEDLDNILNDIKEVLSKAEEGV